MEDRDIATIELTYALLNVHFQWPWVIPNHHFCKF